MFKRGVAYTRDEIGRIVRPDDPPKLGDWTTGYSRIDNKLFVFMNIGVPGRTGHDFENYYDEDTQTLIWFSRPNTRSTTPLFQKLLGGKITPYFFARWMKRSPFTFLGTGSILKFEDGYLTAQGHTCIRFVVRVNELHDIIMPQPEFSRSVLMPEQEERSSFLFEKHLEDFIVTNWERCPFAIDYEIFREDGDVVGKQYPTDTGPIDILAQRKDHSNFLVVELKRDRASDVAVGQTLRYMGWVEEHLCEDGQDVTGCIIAQQKSRRLDYALQSAKSIKFLRYEVDFRLLG